MSRLHEPAALMPTCYAGEAGWLKRVAGEAWDHLWPWSRNGFRQRRFAIALSVGLAAVVTVVWLLAASGRIGANATLAWWIGWSLFEVLVRLQSKPYIKDDPWWGRNFRPANLMDMLCYVSFKNLLIAASIFLAMRLFGVVDALRGLPLLKWLHV